MAIWLKGPDPNGACCDCTNKTSPCDSCSVCQFEIPTPIIDGTSTPYANLAAAQTAINDQTTNCVIKQPDFVPISFGGATTYTKNTNSIDITNQLIDGTYGVTGCSSSVYPNDGSATLTNSFHGGTMSFSATVTMTHTTMTNNGKWNYTINLSATAITDCTIVDIWMVDTSTLVQYRDGDNIEINGCAQFRIGPFRRYNVTVRATRTSTGVTSNYASNVALDIQAPFAGKYSSVYNYFAYFLPVSANTNFTVSYDLSTNEDGENGQANAFYFDVYTTGFANVYSYSISAVNGPIIGSQNFTLTTGSNYYIYYSTSSFSQFAQASIVSDLSSSLSATAIQTPCPIVANYMSGLYEQQLACA